MNINRADAGHIKLWRSINDSDLAYDNTAFVVFLRMVGFAHYEDDFTSIRFAGKQRHLKRGEFSATINELAILTNVPVGTLRKVLERLKDSQRIEMQADNRNTVFRICNYSKYQDNTKNQVANSRANEVANGRANATEGKKKLKNIKKLNIYKEKSKNQILLEVLNDVTDRKFRAFPDEKRTRSTSSMFSADEVRLALEKMKSDEWHRPRISQLSAGYLLSSQIIDKFLNYKTKTESYMGKTQKAVPFDERKELLRK